MYKKIKKFQKNQWICYSIAWVGYTQKIYPEIYTVSDNAGVWIYRIANLVTGMKTNSETFLFIIIEVVLLIFKVAMSFSMPNAIKKYVEMTRLFSL